MASLVCCGTSGLKSAAVSKTNPAGQRQAGVVIPLFSCPGTTSWGIGDIGDIGAATAWLAAAGQRVLQLLPINEMVPGQQSPYSATSAMAIDPLFISVPSVPEFEGESSLSSGDRAVLARVRESPTIEHARVRPLKRRALQAACDRFVAAEWRRNTGRARAFTGFLAEQAWWIEDYALFRAIHAHEGERPWTEWPEQLQRRDPTALADARRELASDVLFYQYLQWLAHTQWRLAREHAHGVALFGDLPFMVDGDSADVWVRQDQFRLDTSVGAPPDAFSATGQDWGMPVYRWDAVARDDFRWLRERARRNGELYDGYRIDHVVGFYRTFARPRGGGEAFFTPADPPDQAVLGERVLAIFRESGAEIIAEDLGTVPNFVRASIGRIGVPGFCVLRWERLWNTEGQPFRDPSEYPAVSVATSGTHDTETLAVWWENAMKRDRWQLAGLPTIRRLAGDAVDMTGAAYSPAVRDVLVEALLASGSDLTLLPLQDVFGWRDRINEPATVTDVNWTFRLPWPVDRLDEVPEARAGQARLRAWSEKHGRI
jgi:4-alpha-glucanotransferase